MRLRTLNLAFVAGKVDLYSPHNITIPLLKYIKNQAEARKILEKLGYGPDKRLVVTVSTRNVSGYRDAAVILIDQLKEVHIDGQLETVDTTQWYPRIMRKDFTVGLNVR